MKELGAMILCGGGSRRMGRAKAELPFEGEAMLARIIRRVQEAARPVVVVAAPGQSLPALPPGVVVVRDPVQGRGPLQGIAAGLKALAPLARYAFASATDTPFIEPAFIRRVFALCGAHEIAVPKIDGRRQPLSAIYCCRIHERVQALVDRGERRPASLFEASDTRYLSREELLADPQLQRVDPTLGCLRNLNTPEEYAQALAESPGSEHG